MEPGKVLLEAYPEIRVATALEGHPRHASSHASAIVLTRDPLEAFAPVNPRDGVLMLDKKDAEKLDILKNRCTRPDPAFYPRIRYGVGGAGRAGIV